jgi:hypothetical protein
MINAFTVTFYHSYRRLSAHSNLQHIVQGKTGIQFSLFLSDLNQMGMCQKFVAKISPLGVGLFHEDVSDEANITSCRCR